ncbi:MAG TPA: TIGR03862 family flavoprotein [Nitrospira sp.]|nr:TIGR03862 family flavoprotein [Nitrospira sp.]
MKIAIIGGGPAGLMAAETAAAGGAEVDLYDAMASVGRKFLLAGKGGLNLTHAEPIEKLLTRYGPRRSPLTPIVTSFGPDAIRKWASGLGVNTFIGTSRRVFPADLKAAPLLRSWLRRLRTSGVRFHVRHRWSGWDEEGAWRFMTALGPRSIHADAVVFALGGASWPQLGSDAAWVPLLRERGVYITPLRPANCGFEVGWSDHLRYRFAGHPLKSVTLCVTTSNGERLTQRGDCVLTETGVEGGAIYPLASHLRDQIESRGHAVLTIDLSPDRERAGLIRDLSRSRGKRTLATHLQRQAGIAGVKAALLREVVSKADLADPARLAAAIKSVPIMLTASRPLAEAISTAGGVAFEELDKRLMLRSFPGVFCAGEMLDWEAPTGGYLLTACFATGRVAGAGAVERIKRGLSIRKSNSTASKTSS